MTVQDGTTRLVSLPLRLRELDDRVAAIRGFDPADYSTAALAALVSPCILLTHNHKHFRPLGVRDPYQGINAVLAAIDLRLGEAPIQAVATAPVAPVVAIGAGAKWAAKRVGPIVWVLLGMLIMAGVVLYRRQSAVRKDAIRNAAGEAGKYLLEETSLHGRLRQSPRSQISHDGKRGDQLGESEVTNRRLLVTRGVLQIWLPLVHPATTHSGYACRLRCRKSRG